MISTTNRSAVILLGISGQIILTALFMWRFEPVVENKLTRASEQALSAAELSFARVAADGRDITLSGMAPEAAQKSKALRIVADVAGVRIVNDKLLVAQSQPQPTGKLDDAELNRRARELLRDIEDTAPIFAGELPYELHLKVEAGVLTMTGLVPDAVAKESLLSLANREFGEGRLIDRLMVAPGATQGYLTAATRGIEAARLLTEGIIGVTGTELFVQGMTNDDEAQRALRSILENDLPDSYTSRLQIGNQKDLTQVLRTYPELAARVGTFAQQGTDTTTITTITTTVPGVKPPVKPMTATATSTTSAMPTEDSPQEQEPAPATIRATIADDLVNGNATCRQSFDRLLSRQAIGFTTGSSQIDESSLDLMATLVAVAKRCPQSRIEIAGHTDDQGSRDNNLRLSQRRAEAVMEYLVRNGVSLGRLSAVGYGEEQPLVKNTTAENRKKNRRIEFTIIDES